MTPLTPELEKAKRRMFAGEQLAPREYYDLFQGWAEKFGRVVAQQLQQPHLLEEYEQAGRIGLWEAANRFKVSHTSGATFYTYARSRLFHRVRQLVRDQTHPHRVLLRKSQLESLENYPPIVSITDLVADPSYLQAPPEDLQSDLIKSLLKESRLTQREQKLVFERIVGGRTLTDLGDQRGVTKERIRQVLSNSYRKLKADLSDQLL